MTSHSVLLLNATILGISKLKVEPYNEDLGTGELRYVQVCFASYFFVLVHCQDELDLLKLDSKCL